MVGFHSFETPSGKPKIARAPILPQGDRPSKLHKKPVAVTLQNHEPRLPTNPFLEGDPFVEPF